MAVVRHEFVRSHDFEDAVRRAASEQRIDSGYWDIFHRHHDVSVDIERRLLAGLGWDVTDAGAIDGRREQWFRANFTSVVPETAVLSESDASLAIVLPEGAADDLCFDLSLEEGGQLSGSVSVAQLALSGHVAIGDERWSAYQFKLPAETPLGYHELRIAANGTSLGQGHVIVCPDRAYIPDEWRHGRRAAGFNVTLYGLRSDRNWGCGDFTDLRTLCEWARRSVGFSFIGLNPLHALHNRVPYNTSPYLPLSLYYKNLIYIDIEAVPEFAASRCAQALLGSPKTQKLLADLRAPDFVQYHEVDHVKRRFLKVLHREFRRQAARQPARAQAFAQFREREGDLLSNFALYCALDEVLHKQDRERWTWRQWPAEFQEPGSDACRAFTREHPRLIEYYCYIQFVLEEQLSAAQVHAQEVGMPIGLYHDLALATDSCGSDLWAHPEYYITGCRVGAPPDDFSPSGQDWAFPPPNAEAHRDNGYRLYRESIRKIMKNGGALRIDHVMRLFRLFWIPEGATAADGTYVRDYATDLMRILALESVRASNVVIGEDLGTVTDEIRDKLAQFAILSYRLFPFEKYQHGGGFKPTWEYPRQALVSSTTHDLATLCGYWLGRDILARKEAGLVDDSGAREQMSTRLREKQSMLDALHREHLLPDWYARDAAHVPEVDGELHNAIVAFLARVPSWLLLLNQEDLTKETEQQNLPGSTAEYPNWQRKMRGRLEDLDSAWGPFAAMFRHQLQANGRALD